MPSFQYRAVGQDGGVVEGILEADNERSATETLKNTGLLPLQVSSPKPRRKGILRRRPHREVILFTTELSVLLEAGLPLDRSLRLLSGIAEHESMRKITEDILRRVREGKQLSEALREHPRHFSTLYVSMVKAGEAGGVLEIVMSKLAELLERSQEVRSEVVSALIYPMLLLFVAGGSVIVLLTVILPKFSTIFADMGRALPLPTRVLLGVSGFLTAYGLIILAVLGLVLLLFRRYRATDAGRLWWDGLVLRWSGGLAAKLHAARFGRTLGTLLQSGVPMLQALANSRDVLGNRVAEKAVSDLILRAREGEGIAGPLGASGVFPPLAVSMVRVGEETGQLDEMLLKVATTFEKDLQATTKRLLALLEPFMILGMAAMVGSILAVMVFTIFSINDLPF